MTSRAELDRLRESNRVIADLVKSELEAIFYALNFNNPAQARDALYELMPLLVDKYGAISAQAATEWYREVMPGTNPTPVTESVPALAVEKRVKYAAGHLWSDDPEKTLQNLTASLGKYARQSGRDTIRVNAGRDKVGYARIPRGPRTCAFCLMLASRSAAWLYSSEDAALYAKDGEKYHGDCNCEADLIRGEGDLPEGWDLDGAYEMYQHAVTAAGGRNDTSEILIQMRRLYPDMLTDGVHLPH